MVEAVLYRLDSPAWQAEVEQSQAQLDELAGLYGRREIGLSEWSAARAPVEQRVTDVRKRLSTLNRSTALDGHVGNAAGLRERWASLPLTRQHGIVAAVLDHVVVGPGRRGYNKFDPSPFSPVWRV